MTTWWGLFSSTQLYSSFVHWYVQKNSGYDPANPWEIYFYLLMHLSRFVVSLLPIMSIFTSAIQRVCVCFYYSIYFFRNYGSSSTSWASIWSDWFLKFSLTPSWFSLKSGWFLKFSLTQANRTCKAFHFIWSCMI